MSAHAQVEFPFASLDFPGRATLNVTEVAERLGIVVQHVIDLIDEGKLSSLDLAGGGNKTSKRCHRIPIESYRDFIIRSMTGPARASYLRALPKHTLLQLRDELSQLITAA